MDPDRHRPAPGAEQQRPASSRSIRLVPWPGDARVGQLVIIDSTPGIEELEGWIERARRAGYERVRTSALFPPSADSVLAAGFSEIDRLLLLEYSASPGRPLPRPERTAGGPRPRRMTRRSDAVAATVDRLAFGDHWGNDAAALAAIRSATPRHRARCVRRNGWRGELLGFLILGVVADVGYLQRLAVHPDHRRRGIADSLVTDALTWLDRRQIGTALVNTARTNDAALGLYRRHGFVPRPEELIVAERRVDARSTSIRCGTRQDPRE